MGRTRPDRFPLKSSRTDREVDHGEEGKVEKETSEEESRSSAQEEENDEVVEEGGSEEESEEGRTKEEEGSAKAEGGSTEGQSCDAEARSANANGQPDADAATRAGPCADAFLDPAVRRPDQLVVRANGDAASGVRAGAAPRAHRNRSALRCIASA